MASHSSSAIQTDKSERREKNASIVCARVSNCVCVCWSIYANTDVKNLLLINYVYLFIIFLKQLRSTTQHFVQSCRSSCCQRVSWLATGITMLSLCLRPSRFLRFHKSAERKMKKYVVQMLLTADKQTADGLTGHTQSWPFGRKKKKKTRVASNWPSWPNCGSLKDPKAFIRHLLLIMLPMWQIRVQSPSRDLHNDSSNNIDHFSLYCDSLSEY